MDQSSNNNLTEQVHACVPSNNNNEIEHDVNFSLSPSSVAELEQSDKRTELLLLSKTYYGPLQATKEEFKHEVNDSLVSNHEIRYIQQEKDDYSVEEGRHHEKVTIHLELKKMLKTEEDEHMENGRKMDNDANEERPNRQRPKVQTYLRAFPRKIIQFIKDLIAIYADTSGSCQNLTKGISLMIVMGAALGMAMPKNDNLSSPYRYFSSVIGYTYFVAWTICYYPQIISNYQRKTSEGLSADSIVVEFVKCGYYTVYNAFFLWDKSLLEAYRARNGPDAEITVMSNDVAFAMNAFLMTFITLCQIFYYDGFSGVSKTCWAVVSSTFVITAGFLICMSLGVDGFTKIDFLYMMAGFKLVLTIGHYIPQLLLNFRRKSTRGFNIWSTVFDFSGGLLSLIQLWLDSVDMNDYSEMLGNWAKLVLALATLLFNIFCFFQHYVLYREFNTSIRESIRQSLAGNDDDHDDEDEIDEDFFPVVSVGILEESDEEYIDIKSSCSSV